MADTGDWLIPRFGGVPTLTRPPLAHWLAAMSGLIMGGFTEWSVRLPFAMAGLALVGLMVVWGCRWYGNCVGATCGLVQATSVYTTLQARLAEADILLCLLTTIALYLASIYAMPPHRGLSAPHSTKGMGFRWIAIYTVLGFSALAKEFIGPILVLLSIVFFLLIQGRGRDLRDLLNPVGLIIFASLAFVWPYLVAQEHPELWSIWHLQVVKRGLGSYLEPKPFWFYAVAVSWLILPWTPLTLYSIPTSWKHAWVEGDAKERYVWVWFLSQTLFLSLSAGKHHHFIIPALPGLSLITGQCLIKMFERLKNRERPLLSSWTICGIIVFWIAVVLGTALFVANRWPHVGGPAYMGLAMCGVLGFLAIGLLRTRRPYAAAAMVLLTYLTAYTVAQFYLIPARDPRRLTADFARNMDSRVPGNRSIVAYGMGWTPTLFYLNRQVAREETVEGLRERLARHGSIYVLTRSSLLEQIEMIGELRRIEIMRPRTESYLANSPLLALVELERRLSKPSHPSDPHR
jgi:4-amino-4-deoxy-L-arabinose transferase-like glycosyltransferase